MPKRISKSKRPRDANQLAKAIVDEATELPEPILTPDGKNRAAVELGRLGGRKGGQARARKLTAKRRTEIARKAAESRWRKQPE